MRVALFFFNFGVSAQRNFGGDIGDFSVLAHVITCVFSNKWLFEKVDSKIVDSASTNCRNRIGYSRHIDSNGPLGRNYSLVIQLLPAFKDNYLFLVQNGRYCVLVDPGDGQVCIDYITEKNLELRAILITHHHPDHVGGVTLLKQKYPAVQIVAPLKNKTEIPQADIYLAGNEVIAAAEMEFIVIEAPGHTEGHVCYFLKTHQALFCGDVIFGMGCGRLFEGTPEEMFETLQKIKKISDLKWIFCAHEYTEMNLKFCEQLVRNKLIPIGFDIQYFREHKEKILQLREKNLPTVPLDFLAELRVNPFLVASDVHLFTELRKLRNEFRTQ